MSVEVWYGERSHHEAEQNTLLELFQHLHPQKEHFVLLHNFFAGQSNEIDLVVLKRDGIFLTELKHVWDPIVGNREGDWKAIREDGSEVILNWATSSAGSQSTSSPRLRYCNTCPVSARRVSWCTPSVAG